MLWQRDAVWTTAPALHLPTCTSSAAAPSFCPPAQALAQATGRKEEVIKAEYDEIGDLGLVAAKARASQKQLFPAAALTVQTVRKRAQECGGLGSCQWLDGCLPAMAGRGLVWGCGQHWRQQPV